MLSLIRASGLYKAELSGTNIYILIYLKTECTFMQTLLMFLCLWWQC